MQIRKAVPDDFLGMYDLVQQAQVDRTSEERSGILEYPLRFEELALRATDNPFAFVADDGTIRAFHLSYTQRKLRELREAGSSITHDPVVARVPPSDTTLYMDLLCTDSAYRQRGFASALFALSVAEAAPKTDLYGATAHRPWRNSAAITFLNSRGHHLIEEISTPSGLVFGLYHRELK